MYQPTKKVVSLVYIAACSIVWLFLQHLISFIFVMANVSFGRTWMVPSYHVLAIALSVGLLFFLLNNKKTTAFLEEVIVELSKVAWPGRKETVISTGIVSVLVAICAAILFFFDMVWGAVVRVFYQ